MFAAVAAASPETTSLPGTNMANEPVRKVINQKKPAALAFNCGDASCFGGRTLRASVMGRDGQVTQLLLNEDGRRTAFHRTQ